MSNILLKFLLRQYLGSKISFKNNEKLFFKNCKQYINLIFIMKYNCTQVGKISLIMLLFVSEFVKFKIIHLDS